MPRRMRFELLSSANPCFPHDSLVAPLKTRPEQQEWKLIGEDCGDHAVFSDRCFFFRQADYGGDGFSETMIVYEEYLK